MMSNTGARVLSSPCKAQSSGDAVLITDALYKAVTKPGQCKEEAVTTEELILAPRGHCHPLGPVAS